MRVDRTTCRPDPIGGEIYERCRDRVSTMPDVSLERLEQAIRRFERDGRMTAGLEYMLEEFLGEDPDGSGRFVGRATG